LELGLSIKMDHDVLIHFGDILLRCAKIKFDMQPSYIHSQATEDLEAEEQKRYFCCQIISLQFQLQLNYFRKKNVLEARDLVQLALAKYQTAFQISSDSVCLGNWGKLYAVKTNNA
jgi:hypothetical protein